MHVLFYVSAGGKGIHRPLAKNSVKGKINKQLRNNSVKSESPGSNNKNKIKGKKSNGNVRPFSYTAFKNYGTSNKKRKRT